MTTNERIPESHRGRTEAQYTAREHGARAGSSFRPSLRTIRFFFFGATAAWGFSVGVAGLLAGSRLAGTPMDPTPPTLLALVPAVAIALAGAGVLAGAYVEAKNRRH